MCLRPIKCKRSLRDIMQWLVDFRLRLNYSHAKPPWGKAVEVEPQGGLLIAAG